MSCSPLAIPPLAPYGGGRRGLDNVFIERLWRSLKHEDIQLKGHADCGEATAEIASRVASYSTGRPHQALGNQTPMRCGAPTLPASSERAVDMPLHLDNAVALPTYPQSQQLPCASNHWWHQEIGCASS
jgi:putative transposase